MALFRCGGGGGMSETVLWTNPSQTSDFVASEIDLSQSIANYKYISVKFKGTKSSTSDDVVVSTLMSVDDFRKADNSSYNRMRMSISYAESANVDYRRNISYISDTRIVIATCRKRSSSSSGSDNSKLIPITFSGVK